MLSDPLAGLGLGPTKTSKKKKQDDFAVLNDSSLDYSIKEFIDSKKAIKDAESRVDRAGAKILQKAEEARLAEVERLNEVITSTIVNGKIRVTSKDQYTDIGSDKKGELVAVLGDEVNDFINVKTSIALKADLAADKDVIQKLIEALGGGTQASNLELGKAKLISMFDISQKLSLKPSFFNKYNLSKEFREKVEPLVENKIVKQHKPTVTEA